MTDLPSHSTRIVWLVCSGIGLLFLIRGAFQPYFFPLFEQVGNLPYDRIAILLSVYVLAQSICAPFAGWFTDRTSVRATLAMCITLGVGSFLIIASNPDSLVMGIAVFGCGLAFVLGKIALNTLLIIHSTAASLRLSVAKRATLLNLGSFAGNTMANHLSTRFEYTMLMVLLGLLYVPLTIGFAATTTIPVERKRPWGIAELKILCRNRAFIADGMRRFAIVLPYGCWGTVIPKFLIDQYGSNDPVWIVYLTSLCTTIIGAHILAVHLSKFMYTRGFKWEWWSMTSVGFYCAGLLLLVFSHNAIMLPLAIVVFMFGEVLMTPCFDETARRHSQDAGMGTCLGLLHFVDGMGRMLGTAFALFMYGIMKGTTWEPYYWPLVVGCFLSMATVVHLAAHSIPGQQPKPHGPSVPDLTGTHCEAGS